MKGKLYVIGLGPGDIDNMTIRAHKAISSCEVLIGYKVYIQQVEALCEGKEVIKSSMGQELDRCRLAIDKAVQGKLVGMVCSGDAGLYGMSGLIYQLIAAMDEKEKPEVEVIPGITAALSCSSLLGAPIVEDFCTISLSDYMVSWKKILSRLEKACAADFVIAVYNPKSNARPDYLREAIKLVSIYRSADTPVGIVRNAYRAEQELWVSRLGELDYDKVDMFCTVLIGNSSSQIIDGKIVTSRGYSL